MKPRQDLYLKLVRMTLCGRPFFTLAEIRRLTNLTPGSLHVTLHRWVRKGILLRPRPQVYCVRGVDPAAAPDAPLDRVPSPRNLGDISKHVLGSMAAWRVRRSLKLRNSARAA